MSSKIPTWKRINWNVSDTRFRGTMAVPGGRAPAKPTDLIHLDPQERYRERNPLMPTAQQDYLELPDAEVEPATPRPVSSLEAIARHHALITIHGLLQRVEPSVPSENFDNLKNLVGLALWEPD